MFNFGGDSPHPHKQETTGLDTIQATSFFPWWLLLFFQEHFEAKGDLQKILKSGKIVGNHRPAQLNVQIHYYISFLTTQLNIELKLSKVGSNKSMVAFTDIILQMYAGCVHLAEWDTPIHYVNRGQYTISTNRYSQTKKSTRLHMAWLHSLFSTTHINNDLYWVILCLTAPPPPTTTTTTTYIKINQSNQYIDVKNTKSTNYQNTYKI